MIVGLHGILERKVSEGAIVRVGGFSLLVHLPTSTLSRLGGEGDEVHLHTYLQVKEDGIALYGFTAAEELGLFHILLGVSGVGPRLALALLSVLSPDQLTLAIASGNQALLTQVPGVGKKTAERLVFELKDKVGRGWVGAAAPGAAGNSEAVAALMSLGYTATEASRALSSLPSDRELTLEEKVRLALQSLGAK